MANIELGPLARFLDDGEIKDLLKALKKHGVTSLPDTDDAGGPVGDELDDDVWADFLDRLDAEDAAADLYVPIEFEGVVEVAGIRIGSSPTLLEVLEEIKDDLAADAEAEEEEDYDSDDDEDDDYEQEEEEEEDDDLRLKERQLRLCWKSLHAGATASVDRTLPLFLKG